MAGVNCEFRGTEQTMNGYDLHTEQNQTPLFSIWCGKDLRFSFSENDMQASRAYFEQVLDVLNSGQSTAIYTIKFHDETNKKGKIDNNTPMIGSYTFRLFDNSGVSRGTAWHEGQQQQPQQQRATDPMALMMVKMQERMLDRMFAQMDAADQAAISGGVDPDFDSKQQFILDIANSEVGSGLIGIIRDILPFKKRGMSQPNQQQNYAGMSGLGDDDVMLLVERIRVKDPQFDKHLAMLCDLAEESPTIYKKAINKLKDIYE